MHEARALPNVENKYKSWKSALIYCNYNFTSELCFFINNGETFAL